MPCNSPDCGDNVCNCIHLLCPCHPLMKESAMTENENCKNCDKLSYLLVECSVPLEQYEYAEQLLRRAKDVIGAVAETGNPDWELLQEINSLLEDGEPTQTT
jgi:hypothetical protein